MNVVRTLIRTPIINIFMFALMPFRSYKEYLLWTLEDNNMTIEELFNVCSEAQKHSLIKFGLVGNTSSVTPQ